MSQELILNPDVQHQTDREEMNHQPAHEARDVSPQGSEADTELANTPDNTTTTPALMPIKIWLFEQDYQERGTRDGGFGEFEFAIVTGFTSFADFRTVFLALNPYLLVRLKEHHGNDVVEIRLRWRDTEDLSEQLVYQSPETITMGQFPMTNREDYVHFWLCPVFGV